MGFLLPKKLPRWLSGKASTCQCRRHRRLEVWSLGWEDSPWEGNGNPLQYSCLENPVDRVAWWDTVQVSPRIRLKRMNTHTHTHTHTRTAWTLDFLSEVGTMCQHSSIHDHFFNIFICLASRFLVVAGRIFSFHSQTPSCSLWDLVLWSGVEPRPAALTAWSLCHGTTREVPYDPFFLNPHVYCQIPPETCTRLKTITLGTHSYEYGNMLKTFTFHSFYYSYHWPLENICIWCM